MVNSAAKLLIFGFVLLAVFLLGVSYANAATYDITINADYSFTPSSQTINTGDTVRWTVSGGNAHVVASDTHLVHYDYPDPSCQDDQPNCWESGVLFNGGSFSFTFLIAGTWVYHDHQDPGQGQGVAGPSSITVTDTNGPATTTDFLAASPGLNSIVLTWTSPGDDGGNYVNIGTPDFYDIRYSTANITDANWSSATSVTGEPSPQVAGSSETMTVTGLSSKTTYYFALKSSDDTPNESGLSNVTSVATTAVVPPPTPSSGRADSTPPARILDLVVGSITTSTVSFSWSAPGDDELIGVVEAYDMRYAQDTITIGNWPSINKVIDEPKPQAAETKQFTTISELSPGITYYFAISSFDEIGNVAPFSNVVSTTTLSVASIQPPLELPSFPEEPAEEESQPEVPEEEVAPIPPTPPPTPPEPLIPVNEGDLIRALGDDKVYIIKDGKRVWIPTRESFNALGYSWDEIKEVSQGVIGAKLQANLIRIIGKQEVYAIKGARRLHIPSAEAFVNEGYKWDNVVVLPEAHAFAYPLINLMRVAGGEKVYIVEDGLRRHIPNIESFNTYGYIWADVVSVSAGELSVYKETDIVLGVEDYKVYLSVWAGDLREMISSLNTDESLSKELTAVLELGDLELCLDTRYYGGGNGRTLFNYDIKSTSGKSFASSSGKATSIDIFKKYLLDWISELSNINSALNKDSLTVTKKIKSALLLGDFELCLNTRHSYYIR